MIDRLARLVVTSLLWLVAIAFAVRLLEELACRAQSVATAPTVPAESSPVSALMTAAFWALFALGLLVRLVCGVRERVAESRHRNAAEERRAPRALAVDVPPCDRLGHRRDDA